MSYRVDTIVAALRNLGGQARTPEIAAEIRRLFPGPHPRTLLDSVRGRLQECSSDSKPFRGKRDLFFSVEGIGGGIWGLRELDISRAVEADAPYPDVDELIERLEEGRQPEYGSPTEIQGRQELLAEIARLRDEIEHLQRPHGGIGHNRPPPDPHEVTINPDIVVAALKETAAIEAEVRNETPNSLTVARSTRWLQALARWLGGKGDSFTDEFVRAFGKSLGKYAGIAVAAGTFILALKSVVESAARWLQLVLTGS